MANRITHSQAYVLDQDEALDFYVGKLGFEVANDVDLGFMRWLTVSLPDQSEHQLLLEVPGPPAHDDATAELVRELVTKGALGVVAIIEVDDVHATYEELKAQGVESPKSPPSAPTASTVGCATLSGITYGSARQRSGRLKAPDPVPSRGTPTGASDNI